MKLLRASVLFMALAMVLSSTSCDSTVIRHTRPLDNLLRETVITVIFVLIILTLMDNEAAKDLRRDSCITGSSSTCDLVIPCIFRSTVTSAWYVGVGVGANVGAGVGSNVGVADGAGVGANVGAGVGSSVGDADGAAVGLKVGAEVGASVGAAVGSLL